MPEDSLPVGCAAPFCLDLRVANRILTPAFVYPSTDAPFYHKGHTIILGLLCYSWVATLANVLYCRKINRDKRNGKYAEFEGSGDDRDPGFVMIL